MALHCVVMTRDRHDSVLGDLHLEDREVRISKLNNIIILYTLHFCGQREPVKIREELKECIASF